MLLNLWRIFCNGRGAWTRWRCEENKTFRITLKEAVKVCLNCRKKIENIKPKSYWRSSQ